jgi:hypothetical protein
MDRPHVLLPGFISVKQRTYTPVLNLLESAIQISNEIATIFRSHSRIALSKEIRPFTLLGDPDFKSVFLILYFGSLLNSVEF